MQDGSVTVARRKRGPDVWCFRWREGGPDGRRIHRRIVLGTADDLKGIASARKVVVGLKREINVNDIRVRRESITLADLSRHFQQRELVRDNLLRHSTIRVTLDTYTQAVNGKAKCAGGSCRALVPRKNAGDVSSAWKNSISGTYFVPFLPTRKWSTFGKFFRKNDGDDETRTRDLCRDSTAF